MVKKQPISKLKYTIEKRLPGGRLFLLHKKDGIQARPEYEEPHSLACSATCEDEDLYILLQSPSHLLIFVPL